MTIIHDPAHSTELLKQDALPDTGYVMVTVHVIIKAIYSFFSRSGKKTRGLERLAKHWNVVLLKLHYLFPIRFVESEARVLEHFITDLPVIVAYLRAVAIADGTSSEVKAKISGWLRKVLQFKFVATCITQLDIDEAMRVFSKQVQSDTALIIDLPRYRAQFKLRLARLMGRLGKRAKARLPELACGELHAVRDKKIEAGFGQLHLHTSEIILPSVDDDGELPVGVVAMPRCTCPISHAACPISHTACSISHAA